MTSGSTVSYINVSNYIYLEQSGRSRRSLSDEMPMELTVSIKDVSGDIFHLNWYKTMQYLANENLPVDMPLDDFKHNIMKDIGEFVMYHDLEKSSAVIYFAKQRVFYGTIGMDYYVQNIPFNHQNKIKYLGVFESPYVVKRENAFFYIGMDFNAPSISNMIIPSTHDSDRTDEFHKRAYDFGEGPSTKRQRTDQDSDNNDNRQKQDATQSRKNCMKNHRGRIIHREYFSETLIFVTRDVVETFKKSFKQDYIESIIRYYLIYFNAVDMFFNQICGGTYDVYINIAKIVIEDNLLPFSFINGDKVKLNDVASKLPQYLETYQAEYPPDSFDHVFISTRLPIMDKFMVVPGLTRSYKNLYESRKNNKKFYDVVPITIIGFQYYSADYVIAIKEISRVWEVNINLPVDQLFHTDECYVTTQKVEPSPHHTMKWNVNSRREFKSFFSLNRNRCYLLNKPRSLVRPRITNLITPFAQCKCFGYDYYKVDLKVNSRGVVGANGCTVPLACHKGDIESKVAELTVRPFDGTPCEFRRVCWEGKCRKMTNYPD